MIAAERDLRRRLRAALRAGYTLERAKSGHLQLRRPDGVLVVTIAHTSSDHRHRKNLERDLRAAGVPS